MEVEVHYLAVLAAAIAAMVVGFLWYGPVCGSVWKRLMGFWETVPRMALSPLQAYSLGFVAALVQAYVLFRALIFAE